MTTQTELALLAAKKWDGNLIREVRRALKLKQEDVAAQVGVSQEAVSGWENGKEPWTRNRHKMIAWVEANLDAVTVGAEKKDSLHVLQRHDGLPLRFQGRMLGRRGDCAVYRTAGGALVVQADTFVVHGHDDAAVADEVIGNASGDQQRRLAKILFDVKIDAFEDIA